MTSTRFVSLLVLIPLVIALPAPLAAQDSATGAIRGTVVDASGSRIARASIVVVNTATGARYTATSDGEGRFALELLPPGDYSARVVAEGMSPQVTPQLHVDVGGAAELGYRLSVAGVRENITVSASPNLVDTNPSAVSTLLDERAIGDLPLNGRAWRTELICASPTLMPAPWTTARTPSSPASPPRCRIPTSPMRSGDPA
jgi:hypothetical protein